MNNMSLWLRWSWRDLRARWLQVVAISIIIALGSAMFAGLGGVEDWRIRANDLNYARLNMYDLRMALSDGSYLDRDELAAALADIPGVARSEARLVTPTLVDASDGGEALVVRGEIVGVDVSDGGPHVSSLYVKEGDGRTLTEADSGQPVAVVEYHFADHYDLEPGDPIRISGDVALDYAGTGFSPEYFMIIPETGMFFGESSFAVIFLPLETAQQLAGREGLVNDVAFILTEDADSASVQAAIEARMEGAFPATGYAINTREDTQVYTTLYKDAESDQWMYNALATLFLFGAAMGAFNLAGRMVEAQRREIGIGMALGVPRRWLAFRPLLVGLQIAVLGTALGLLVGLGVGKLFQRLLEDMMPLPYWEFSFQFGGFLRAALFGILLPVLATLIPVWRAVRVAPVDAITTGYLVAKGGGLARFVQRLPLPGKSFVHMPVKNVLRSPWRSGLTVLAIAIAVLIMTAVVGTLDTFVATIEGAEDATLNRASDRFLVNLDFFYPANYSGVTGIESLVGADGELLFTGFEPAMLVGGWLIHGDEKIETALELHDMGSALWTPAVTEGALTADEPGLIISDKAARDLGVSVGDRITLEHPHREGLLSFRFVQSEVPVIGIHDNPLRAYTYMDMNGAALMGLDGLTNYLILDPAPGVQPDEVKLALLTQPGVTSSQAVTEFSDAMDELLAVFTSVLSVAQAMVVAMAFLIAFNTTSISVDERVREIATMFAFGLRIRTVMRMQMLENLVIGVVGTIIGVAGGWVVINELFRSIGESESPDIGYVIALSMEAVALAALLGMAVVALTPLLRIRRLRKMDIPSTLRVME